MNVLKIVFKNMWTLYDQPAAFKNVQCSCVHEHLPMIATCMQCDCHHGLQHYCLVS